MDTVCFPQSRVEPLVERILENGEHRLRHSAHGWWETEDDGFVLLVAWHQTEKEWEFFLRWECEETKGADTLCVVEADSEEEALRALVPGMKDVLETPVSLNGNGSHAEKAEQ